MISASAMIGLGQGFQPVCGFNYGAKLYGRVKRAFGFCVYFSGIILVTLGVFAFIFAPGIIALFRKDDPDVIRIDTLALRLHCFAFPLGSWIVMVSMMLQTIGKAVPASILALARQGIFFIPLPYTLVPAAGILGIQLCTPISDICSFLLALPLGIWALRKVLGD
jgi:Na+-driven multidrug efflux pump